MMLTILVIDHRGNISSGKSNDKRKSERNHCQRQQHHPQQPPQPGIAAVLAAAPSDDEEIADVHRALSKCTAKSGPKQEEFMHTRVSVRTR